ncbi:MAG: response regulator [Patescibacteria group bacterium]
MAEKKTILIVEDDFYLVRAYSLKFEKEGVNVVSAGDGEAAIEFLEKNKQPDMIILDLMLPKKNGFEVLQEIKSNNKWKNIPLVILSNLGQEEDIKKGKEMGALDYIIKADTSIEEAIGRIKKHL